MKKNDILNQQVSEHYETNEAFASVLNQLIENFEYPNWSWKTIRDVFDYVKNHQVPLVCKSLGIAPEIILLNEIQDSLRQISSLKVNGHTNLTHAINKIIERKTIELMELHNVIVSQSQVPLYDIKLPMNNAGKNPGKYTMEVGQSGDAGLYDEFRVSILDKSGDCVGDALIGLDQNHEPRVLVTTGGNGNDGKQVSIYPLREMRDAVVDEEDNFFIHQNNG